MRDILNTSLMRGELKDNRTARTSPRTDGASTSDAQTTVVYERLRELIVRGQLAPGARLVEQEIATRLGTSRTPVRSALQRLQQERYSIVPEGHKHARMTVAPLTMDDAQELLEIVGGLEAAAARRAALLGMTTRVRLSTRLTEINSALLHATRNSRPDQDEVFGLDTGFHRTYVEAGAGPRMLALHDVVKPQAERYIRLYISALLDQIASSIAEHEVIIQAIRRGDAAGTESAVLVNWRNAAERLSEVIAKLGERGTW
jgi:DNA-binding GntR family transcriptional regulator